ncbi:spore protein alpha/beta [Clostridiales bacterium PH28_bin88]|nr:spore protein alpha/beta [Clostridiales bacterium PH28_bin88]
MAKFTGTDKLLPEPVLEEFKYEIAEDMGIGTQVREGYWGEVTSRDCGHVGGKIGGNMVKVMIREVEKLLAGNPI